MEDDSRQDKLHCSDDQMHELINAKSPHVAAKIVRRVISKILIDD